MKIKQTIIITNPEEFLRGDYGSCFNLFDGPRADCIPEWVDLYEIEIDLSKVKTDAMIEHVSAHIDNTVKEFEGKIAMLKARKAELLALPFDGDS